MKLRIISELTDEAVRCAGVDTKVIDIRQFNDIGFHPFIAVTKWEEIQIQLDPKIKSGFIKQILFKHGNIKAYLKSETPIDMTITGLAAEVLPEYSAEIRKTVFSKGNVESILIKGGVIVGDLSKM